MGYYCDYTEYDADGNVRFADPPIEERAKRPIICPKCIGSYNIKYCGFKQHGYQQATSCSKFWPKPKRLKDWLRYFYITRLRNPFLFIRYKIVKYLQWLKYANLECGHIPSIIKAGDVIEYRCSEKIRDRYPGEFDEIQTMQIKRIWVTYDRNDSEHKFCIMATTTNGMTTALNGMVEGLDIISINGKTTYKDIW